MSLRLATNMASQWHSQEDVYKRQVIIKATDKASYKNVVDALDEMQICSIGKYVLDKISKDDEKLLKAKAVE